MVIRIQVDTARVTVQGTGQVSAGVDYELECADNGDPAVTDVAYTTANVTDIGTGGTSGGAGTADIQFAGTAADELIYVTGYTFTYSGDGGNPAADGTYTVRAPGGTHVAGTVTVPVEEAIPAVPAPNFLGTLEIEQDIAAIAAGLHTAHGVAGLGQTSAYTPGNVYLDITTQVAAEAMIVRTKDRAKCIVTVQALGGAGADDAAKWKTSLTAAEAAGYAWYVTMACTRTAAIQEGVAEWINSRRKVYAVAASDANIGNQTLATDTTSIAARLKLLGYGRSFGIFHTKADMSSTEEWIEAGRIAANIHFDLDNTTNYWLNKNIQGVTPDRAPAAMSLSDTQVTNIVAKRFDYYAQVLGLNQVVGGTVSGGGGGQMANGTPISTRIGADVLAARMEETLIAFVYNAANNDGGIPFTVQGQNSVLGKIQSVVEKFLATGFLRKDYNLDARLGYSIYMPPLSSISAADQTNGILSGIVVKAKVAGAILHISISVKIA